MEERNELIKELFELHKLLADKGEISIGYGFSENYNRLEAEVKKLTIPVVSVPKNEGTLFCQHCKSKNVTVGDGGLWCTDCGKLTKRQNNAH